MLSVAKPKIPIMAALFVVVACSIIAVCAFIFASMNVYFNHGIADICSATARICL